MYSEASIVVKSISVSDGYIARKGQNRIFLAVHNLVVITILHLLKSSVQHRVCQERPEEEMNLL